MGLLLAALIGFPIFLMAFAGAPLLLTFRSQGSIFRRAGWGVAAWAVLAISVTCTWARKVPVVFSIGPAWSVYLAWLVLGRQEREMSVPAWRYYLPVVTTIAFLIVLAAGAVKGIGR